MIEEVKGPLVQLGFELQRPDIHCSDVVTYRQCRRKHLLSTMYGLRLKAAPRSSALDTGTFYHLGMYDAYRSSDLAVGLQSIDAETNRIIMELVDNQDSLGRAPNGLPASLATLKVEEDASKAKAMVSWAWTRAPWPDAPDTLDDWEILGLEQTVRAYIKAIGGHVRVTFDMVVRNRDNGAVWVIDHKTTDDPPAETVNMFSFALQPQVYTVVANALYGNVHGFCYNVIQKPTIKHKKKQTFDDYLDEVGEWYDGTGRHEEKYASRMVEPCFVRAWPRFPTTLSQEVVNVLVEYRMALHAKPFLHQYDRNTGACRSYNRICPFFELCRKDYEGWSLLLADNYEAQPHRSAGQENVVEVSIE